MQRVYCKAKGNYLSMTQGMNFNSLQSTRSSDLTDLIHTGHQNYMLGYIKGVLEGTQ